MSKTADLDISPAPFDQPVRLSDYDPDTTGGLTKAEAKGLIKANLKRMTDLQELMFAEGKHALLIACCRRWTPVARTARSAT